MGNALTSPQPDPTSLVPSTDTAPTFDPNYGFPKGRKKRVMVATEEEMVAANVPLKYRDYCAHKFIEVDGCVRRHFPFWHKCDHLKHEYGQCEYEDYVLRMKEYERERRLRARRANQVQAVQAAA